MVIDHPVQATNDVENAPTPVARQHTYRNDGNCLGHTVGLASNSACHVRTVSVAIFGASTVLNLIVTSDNSTTEITVVAANARVDDVRIHS